MKTTMKKALSLILTAAMLLSVALTATVATSAEDSNAKFNSYIEFYNPSGSSNYGGIKVDGVKTGGMEVDANGTSPCYLHSAIVENKVYLGLSHSSANPNYSVNANELHMNVLVTDGSTITDIYFTTSGKEYYINQNHSGAWLWNTSDMTDENKTVYDSTVGEYKKVNDTYYEWRLALKQLRLETVYDETNPSTDFSITVKTSSGTYKKSGRLVLNATFNPNHVWNSTNFAKKDISGITLSANKGTVNHDTATKTTTLSATVDGTRSTYAMYNTNATWTWQMFTQMAWEYNMDLTVSEMPDIKTDALVLSCNGVVGETNTPALVFYLTDTNVNNNGKTKGLAVGIFNRDGQLYIASPTNTGNAPSNEVALGVAPSENSFKLRLAWTFDGNYTVFVNDVKVGTVLSGTNGMHLGSARFITSAELHGGSNYNGGKQSVKIQNFTVEHSSYGVAETLIAASATPNYVPAIKFYQTSAVENGTYNVRLVATVDKALVDAGEMTAAGFNVAASKTNTEGTVNGTTKAHNVYEVYSSITASGEEVKAPEGTYFLVFTIKGIPVADTLTLNFSAFAETVDAAYVEGSVFTLTFENGARKN